MHGVSYFQARAIQEKVCQADYEMPVVIVMGGEGVPHDDDLLEAVGDSLERALLLLFLAKVVQPLGCLDVVALVSFVGDEVGLQLLANLDAVFASPRVHRTHVNEEAARLHEYREKFDFATARAVAEMRVLSELCLPFVKVGGEMLAMKGKNAEFELSGAKRAISLLGGADASFESVTLLGGGEEFSHPIIKVRKKNKTPATYPRPYAQISKKPL